MKKINNLGFTLVELLVVIAIIGILSSVAVVNLSSARNNAKTAAVKYSLASLSSAILLCYDDDQELTARFTGACPGGICYCNDNYIPWSGHAICNGSVTTWPNIAQNGFSYLECDPSNPQTNTWTLMATNGSEIISCNIDGCV
ncbi:type II secretion system protein [Candidatus Nomurabacteria bacterium]|nr:type II secretion system protein [Candidatus Nomurabacteria bacterium]